MNIVELECASCNGPVKQGITIAFPVSALTTGAFNGNPTKYSLALNEDYGWLIDPQNTLKSWSKPTKCQFIQVLSGLSAVRILGDWTTWYESVALDDVGIYNTKSQLPTCAMTRPDASICTC